MIGSDEKVAASGIPYTIFRPTWLNSCLSFEGWSVHEIAEEMQIPAERISDEKYKAIRKLREKLSEN